MGRNSTTFGSDYDAKTTLVGLLLIFGTFYPASKTFAQNEELIDRVAAVADGRPILHSDIVEKVEHGPLIVVSDFPATEKSLPFERALQDAINYELILQKAKELEIEVREDEVEMEIKRFLEARNLDHDGLLRFLNQQGQTYDQYKTDFRDQMILRRFQGRVIAPMIKITDKDVETYYLKKSGATADLVELTLRQILIRVAGDATPEVLQAKQNLAREVHAKLQGGLDFKDAVKIYSDDTSARETGGLMLGVKLKDLSGAIRQEVENLESLAFTNPIQTNAGFHIFFLEERKFSGSRDFLEQKQALEGELRSLELNTQTRRWLTEQRQKSKVETISQ